MMRRRFLPIVLSATVLELTACHELPTSAPPGVDPAFSAGTATVEYTDAHVVQFAGNPKHVETRVTSLGGSVLRMHPQIGVAVVAGLSDAAAAQLATDRDIGLAVRDVSVRMLPDPGATVMADRAAPAGHDPTTAIFFPIQWNMQIIGADEAWGAGFDDATGVRVAILDTGIDPFHVDMVGRVDAGSSIAFVNSLNGAGPPWGDDHFHGTHVAGTVSTNGFGTSGVAPHATLIAVKVCDIGGSCSFAAIISGLVHAADERADVINMSLAGFINVPAPGGGALNAMLNRAINYAQSRGALVVSAAGNAAVDLDHIERDFRVNAIRATPCENGAGMCISATGPTDMLAFYSNYGRSAINIAAPGGDITVSGNPATDLVLAPCSTLSLVIPVCQEDGWYLWLQGTSMAAPHVAGAAALYDAQYGGALNAGRLRTALERSADDLGKRGADPLYGRGRLNVARLLGVN